MHRSWLVVLSLLVVSTLGFGQSASNDSQGMQALVAEVRQLRKDLQASNGNALKAQILLARLQFQETAVARASQHLNEMRGRLADAQRHLAEVTARMKRLQEVQDNDETANQKAVQGEIAATKVQLENVTAEEQQRQAAETDAEEQLRTEQAKLGELEDRVDRLEKDLTSNPK